MSDNTSCSGEPTKMTDSLLPLFSPQSIAVIGASDDASKYGHRVLRNILDGGFEGRVYPIHPSAVTVLNLQSHKSIRDIPERVDLAVVVIPAALVLKTVREAVEAGVRSLVIITAGFGETGDAGGRAEAEIRSLCQLAHIPVVGPNCMGVCSFQHGLAATMVALQSAPGHISFISQSGSYGVSMLNYGTWLGAKFNVFVSSGNEAVTRFSDYLNYLGNDSETHVIMGYVESLKDARTFVTVARVVTRRKPVVIMKFGRTARGSLAAASHTGALAGPHSVYSAAFRQSGIVEVTRTRDLLNTAMAFSMQPPLAGCGIGVVGTSGGFAVAVTDYLVEQGLEVPTLAQKVQEEMRHVGNTMPYASLRNPVDLAADMRPSVLLKCAGIMLGQPEINGLIVGLAANPFPPDVNTISEIERIQGQSNKSVLLCYYGRPQNIDVVQRMTTRLPVYGTPEEVAQVMAHLRQYGEYIGRI